MVKVYAIRSPEEVVSTSVAITLVQAAVTAVASAAVSGLFTIALCEQQSKKYTPMLVQNLQTTS